MKMKGRDIVKRVKNIFRKRSFYIVYWGRGIRFVFPEKTVLWEYKTKTKITNNFEEKRMEGQDIKKVGKGAKVWSEMTDGEKDDYLGSLGGCSSCVYWSRVLNNYRQETGCVCPIGIKGIQIYDNGCTALLSTAYNS
jgi:hypothetical protein